MRSKWVLGILLTIALLGGLALSVWQPRADWSLADETIDAIEPGMSRAEVEQLLGGPPGFRGDLVKLYYGMHRHFRNESGWTPVSGDAEDAAMSSGDPEELPARLDGLWIGSFAVLEEDAAGSLQPTQHRVVMALRIKFDAAGKVIDKRYYQGMGTRKPSRLETWRDWIEEKLGWDEP